MRGYSPISGLTGGPVLTAQMSESKEDLESKLVCLEDRLANMVTKEGNLRTMFMRSALEPEFKKVMFPLMISSIDQKKRCLFTEIELVKYQLETYDDRRRGQLAAKRMDAEKTARGDIAELTRRLELLEQQLKASETAKKNLLDQVRSLEQKLKLCEEEKSALLLNRDFLCEAFEAARADCEEGEVPRIVEGFKRLHSDAAARSAVFYYKWQESLRRIETLEKEQRESKLQRAESRLDIDLCDFLERLTPTHVEAVRALQSRELEMQTCELDMRVDALRERGFLNLVRE